MKLTKTLIKKIIKEELENLTTETIPYNKMTDEQLLAKMDKPSFWKEYFFALAELEKRTGFEELKAQGKIPSFSSPGASE